MNNRMTVSFCIGLLLFTFVFLPFVHAADALNEQMLTDAYVYILGRALIVRQEQLDMKEPGSAYNTARIVTVEPAEAVNPNLALMSLEAWIAVDESTPVFLDTPEIKGRYYTVQISDEWGEVIINLNERSLPQKPYGKYVFVGPGSKEAVPQDAFRIDLRSGKAKMIAQVELRGDPETAARLLRRFVLTPLGKPEVKPPVAIPYFTGRELPGVELFEISDALITGVTDSSPAAAEMQGKVRALAKQAALNSQEKEKIGKLIREKAIPQFLRFAQTKAGKNRNNWTSILTKGNYGKDYWMRTAENFSDPWANAPSEEVHFIAAKDADGRILQGNTDYIIYFPKGQRPDDVAGSFWSVTMLSAPDNRVVPNQMKRYLFESYSGLKYKKDGSLSILISRQPKPGIPESNWLPSPEDGPFSLTLRIYAPKDTAKTGEWFPPGIEEYTGVK